jgi:glycosyltransferase involved in cell wall biosynthesis
MKDMFITPEEMLAIPAVEISDLSRMAPAPLVSVVVVTYNHEAYIAQNIEGILAQQCNFPIELIIGEDHSSDRTLEICLSYQQKHPDVIRVVTWHENVGISANYLRVLGRAQSKFIAFCEGDDYWIDPAKLTKQVALMEQWPDTTLCGARTRVLREIPGKEPVETLIGPDRAGVTFSLKDLVGRYPFHTSTFLLRKSSLLLTQHFRSIIYPDGYLLCLSALQGSMRCIPDVVSVYRHHSHGLCIGGSLDDHFDRCEFLGNTMLDIVSGDDVLLVKRSLDIMNSRRCHHLINDGRIDEARRMAPVLCRRFVRHDFGRALLLFLHVYLPKPYASIRILCEDVGIAKYVKRFIF